jgi:hypothetical protein
MPLPLLIGAALLGSAATKQKDRNDFQAVRGRKKKDGTTGKTYVRKKARSR